MNFAAKYSLVLCETFPLRTAKTFVTMKNG